MGKAEEVLELVVASKDGGEVRQGQVLMTQEVERALQEGSHLLVEAGTGTGKSLAYLVPAVLKAAADPQKRCRIVVSTATKALQDQLFNKDLPFLREALKKQNIDFTYSILKGRSNYACLAKVDSLKAEPQILLDLGDAALGEVAQWLEETTTGDRAERNFSSKVWSEISVDPGECPGAQSCPFANDCFAEKAKAKAGASDIVVVNTSLYAAHLASDLNVLPDHAGVVFDEAHTLEDVSAQAFSVSVGASRVGRLSSLLKRALKSKNAESLRRAAGVLELELETLKDQKVLPFEPPLALTLESIRGYAFKAQMELGDVSDPADPALHGQAKTFNESLLRDLSRLLDETQYVSSVAYVETQGKRPVLKLTPVDVASMLASSLFSNVTTVTTSATLSVGGSFEDPARRFGLNLEHSSKFPDGKDRPLWRSGIVPSPFNFKNQGLLYLPRMPHPRNENFMPELLGELDKMITALNGRTLALFTSRRAMNEAAEQLSLSTSYQVLNQDEMPRPMLLEAFREEPGSVIVATQGFWTGIDIPGDDLALVTLDKIPFPRPNDPLVQARRDMASRRGMNPFRSVDLPAAATLLAQGAGRLIRSRADRGVIAVFDPRFQNASYAEILQGSMPPFQKTNDLERVLKALEWINSKASVG